MPTKEQILAAAAALGLDYDGYGDVQAALIAADRAAWCFDMSKAPDDGTKVLLVWKYWTDDPVVGWFVKAYDSWECDLALSNDEPPPTAWRPLPMPPEVNE